jgi:hypothetical protein
VGGLLGGVEVIHEPVAYHSELMEKARWIVEHGHDKPHQHEIERQLQLPLPTLPCEPEKAKQ